MLKTIKHYFTVEEVQIKKEIVEMRIFNLILSFLFLFVFLFVEKIPLEVLFRLYGFFTDYFFQVSLVVFSIVTLLVGFLGKNWNFSIAALIFLLGQVMFIHVFADKYSLSGTIEKESLMDSDHLPKITYSNMWNKG